MSVAYVIELPLTFPEGIHCGAGSFYNSLLLARDGAGHPVLNGSSLAGTLRALYRQHLLSHHSPDQAADYVERLFGRALSQDVQQASSHDLASCVRVSNYRLDLGHAHVDRRTFHLRDRHRGTVASRGLFQIEAAPPGTRCRLVVWIHERTSVLAAVTESQILEFIGLVHHQFEAGILLGGNSNRGLGRAVIAPGHQARWQRFDLAELASHAEYLEAHLAWRRGESLPGLKDRPVGTPRSAPDALEFCITCEVSRGQDILVADGQAEDVQMEPQRVLCQDGNYFWRIPGSSVRGLFKQWMTRLAARAGYSVGDNAARYERDAYTGVNVGWAIANTDERKEGSEPNCPIGSLFGTLGMPGRIKFTDAYIRCSHAEHSRCTESQMRTHVAVDRVTGGAAEGMLFSNRVLTSEASPFLLSISIQRPRDHEVQWLAQTLVALHIGLLRLGSSKSSGRITVKNWSSRADGPLVSRFKTILQQAGIGPGAGENMTGEIVA
jgi:CRISPR/Cas system CSM-associated protein Csm3 (group 7 of RAMP superfamily)